MASVTLDTLRSRVREHADMVSTSFVADSATSLDGFINTGVQRLHDLVLNAMGDEYLGVSSSAISPTIASGTGTVALPSDFYRLLGVDLTVGGQVVDLKRFAFKERNAYRSQGAYAAGSVPVYRLDGANIRLNGPNGTYAGTLWYAPAPTLLESGVHTVNYPNGWEAFAVYHAAVAALAKEESDVSVLFNLMAAIQEQIEVAASHRDSGSPPRMVDVERAFTDSDSEV